MGSTKRGSIQKVKVSLSSPPVLAYPDFNKRFRLQTDASCSGLGAVLSQEGENGEEVIAYASRVLNDAEKRYSTIEQELLAIIWAVDQFRVYL